MEILAELESIIKPLLEKMGVELVELQFNAGKRVSVRLFVWESSGISLDRCSEISRLVSDALDQRDVVHGKYSLEVSSPGIDRPMKTKRDFERQIGRKAKIIVKDGEKTKTLEGRIKGVSDESVALTGDNGDLDLNLNVIISAKVVVEF